MSKKEPRIPRPRVISVRVSEEEYEQLQHFARLSGLSLSDYLRRGVRPPIVTTSAGVPTSVTWRIS